MSRLHVHLHVRDLEQSLKFYSTLFGTPPTRKERGYAKWTLDDPKVNFAISTGGAAGLSHLGIQVETDSDLEKFSVRAREAAGALLVERGARCCYATGNKAWATDPQGIQWETFHTTADLDEAGSGADAVFSDGNPADAEGCGCAKLGDAAQTAPAVCCAP